MFQWTCPICGEKNSTDSNRCCNAERPDHDRYNTFFRRCIALWIDGEALAIVALLKPPILTNVHETNAIVAALIFFLVLPTVYAVVCNAVFGKTIGKHLTGLKVVSIDETPLSWWGAIRRDSIELLIKVIPVVWALEDVEFWRALELDVLARSMAPKWERFATLIFGFWLIGEVVSVFASRKRRALHDYVAGSVVVRAAAPKWVAAVGTIIALIGVSLCVGGPKVDLESWAFNVESLELRRKSAEMIIKVSATRKPMFSRFFESNPTRYLVAEKLPDKFFSDLIEASTRTDLDLSRLKISATRVPYNEKLGLPPQESDEIVVEFRQRGAFEASAPAATVETKALTDSISLRSEEPPASKATESTNLIVSEVTLDFSRSSRRKSWP